jgi:hypothetical protein
VEEAPTMNRDAGIGLLRRTPSRPGVRRSIRDLALLVAGSPLGLRRSPGQAPLEHSIAHTLWATVTPGHRYVLRHLLKRASHRPGEKERHG